MTSCPLRVVLVLALLGPGCVGTPARRPPPSDALAVVGEQLLADGVEVDEQDFSALTGDEVSHAAVVRRREDAAGKQGVGAVGASGRPGRAGRAGQVTRSIHDTPDAADAPAPVDLGSK
jgi:hypothetical protein